MRYWEGLEVLEITSTKKSRRIPSLLDTERMIHEAFSQLFEEKYQDWTFGHKDIQTTQIYINRIKFKKDKHSRSLRDRIKPIEQNDS